ncbi:MAG: hypothetical protein ACD_61C00263G0001, partial [uncultured bacterium]
MKIFQYAEGGTESPDGLSPEALSTRTTGLVVWSEPSGLEDFLGLGGLLGNRLV